MSDPRRLDFCRSLAREAGRLAHTGFGASAAALKGRHDIVTSMDSKVEGFVRAAIAERYPTEAVVGEEEGGRAGDAVWLVDPIDGTANYARGIPRYCVSIGFVERGIPVVGAIYDPSHDVLYSAASGAGAFRNGSPIAVSDCAALDEATVECGWSTRRSTDDYVALVGRVLHAGCAFRRAGSGALGLADVASGACEGYCELHINAWDCAAGIVLVREAGGATNDFFAGDGMTKGNALIATNAALSRSLASIIGIAIAHRDERGGGKS